MPYLLFLTRFYLHFCTNSRWQVCLRCFDVVGWASRRASGL